MLFFRGEVVSVSERRTQFQGYKLKATVDNKDVRIGRLVSTAGSEVKFCFGAVSTCANLAAIKNAAKRISLAQVGFDTAENKPSNIR